MSGNKPCKDCPSRYPGCSSHCQKPEYLAWREELAKIRENRQKYQAPVWASIEPYNRRKV